MTPGRASVTVFAVTLCACGMWAGPAPVLPMPIPPEAAAIPWAPLGPPAEDCSKETCHATEGVWLPPTRADYLARWRLEASAVMALMEGELTRRDEQWGLAVDQLDAERMACEASLPDAGRLPWWGWLIIGTGLGATAAVVAGAAVAR